MATTLLSFGSCSHRYTENDTEVFRNRHGAGQVLRRRDKQDPERGEIRWQEEEKVGMTVVTIDQQIERAQEKVIKTRQAYDAATDALQKLLDKRDAKRKDNCGMLSSKVRNPTRKSTNSSVRMLRDKKNREKSHFVQTLQKETFKV